MDMTNQAETQGQKVLNKYATYGLIVGLFFGLVTGILISGPNFSVWPASSSLLAIFGSGAGGALLGFLLPGLAVGFFAGGTHDGNNSTPVSDGNSGTSDSGGCGGDGDGGACAS